MDLDGDRDEELVVSPVAVSGLSITRDLAVVRRRDRPLSPPAQAFLKLL